MTRGGFPDLRVRKAASGADEQAGHLVRVKKVRSGEVLVAVRATIEADAIAAVARVLGLSANDRMEVVCALNARALAKLDVVADTPAQIGPV